MSEAKQKYLRVTMPDGSKWDVPASLIAHNRARYYQGKKDLETIDMAEREYQVEYDYAMTHDHELEEWAASDMNWSDVEHRAMKVSDGELPDYQEGWVNGEKEIVER
jgi:hypothetical protein